MLRVLADLILTIVRLCASISAMNFAPSALMPPDEYPSALLMSRSVTEVLFIKPLDKCSAPSGPMLLLAKLHT